LNLFATFQTYVANKFTTTFMQKFTIMKRNIILTAVIASVLSSILSVLGFRYFSPERETSFRDNTNAKYANFTDFTLSGKLQRSFLSSAPTNFTKAAEMITSSVVNIKSVSTNGGDNMWNESSLGTSTGSGVIMSADGFIVTNNHVVADASEIQVTLDDKREYSAKIVGTDPSTDLAVLKIDAQRLVPVKMGNSDSMRVGEWVLAVGNPFNLESTVTAGIISAKGRSINILEDSYSIESFIQTDAAVNPGNSGGALVNTNGELIGINTAIITKSGRYEGYSFAIPINLAMKVIRDLINYKVVQRGLLGVEIKDLTPSLARSAGYTSMNGVYVYTVNEKSAAEDGGMRQGDVIIGIEGIKIKSKSELLEQIGRKKPGDKVSIEYIRNGKPVQSSIILKNKSNTTGLLIPEKFDVNLDGFKKIGISDLRPLTSQESRKTGLSGIKVVSIDKGSRIDRTNMEIGFIITHINKKRVESIEQGVKLLATTYGKVVLEGIYEDFTEPYFYTFNK
jgi:serine protease Do